MGSPRGPSVPSVYRSRSQVALLDREVARGELADGRNEQRMADAVVARFARRALDQDQQPEVGVAMMLATSFYVLVLHGRDVSLLQSWLPLAALLAIAHAGRSTLAVATLLFAGLLLVELTWTPRVHHACVYSGLLVLMSAIRTYREHRSLAPLWSALRAPLTGSSS